MKQRENYCVIKTSLTHKLYRYLATHTIMLSFLITNQIGAILSIVLMIPIFFFFLQIKISRDVSSQSITPRPILIKKTPHTHTMSTATRTIRSAPLHHRFKKTYWSTRIIRSAPLHHRFIKTYWSTRIIKLWFIKLC